jgi:hypothetical protein
MRTLGDGDLKMLTALPSEVQSAIAALSPVLMAAHLSPVACQYSEQAFGNFVVTFRGQRGEITLIRDRGQFIVKASDRDSLERAGLWRAFDTAQELLPPLSKWLLRSGPGNAE